MIKEKKNDNQKVRCRYSELFSGYSADEKVSYDQHDRKQNQYNCDSSDQKTVLSSHAFSVFGADLHPPQFRHVVHMSVDIFSVHL